jgi:hypothetical protein
MPDKNALLAWRKILPDPNGEDLGEALRCEVRDPLWLLARQWQLGEFNADDAGMLAFAQVETSSAPAQRMLGKASPSAIAPQTPLNVAVEKMSPGFDLHWRIETGSQWKTMLQRAGKTDLWERFRQQTNLQFKVPASAFEPENEALLAQSQESYAQLLATCALGRTIDGQLLYEALEKQKASALINVNDPVIDELGQKWRTWVNSQLFSTNQCWDPSRLEYRFQVAASPDGVANYLNVAEYNGQDLGWQDFALGTEHADLKKDLNLNLKQEQRLSLIPSRVSFPGMPRARWWEIEDQTIDLSNIKAAKTDTGALLLSEFCLLYSNDWLQLPLTLPLGSLSKVKAIRVNDVFGVQFKLEGVQGKGKDAWKMFVPGPNQAAGSYLYLPPVAASRLQSAPIEEVHFLRDEMANMVWALEKTISNQLVEGIDGQLAAQMLEEMLLALVPPNANPAPLQVNEAALQYTLGTEVNPHWIPFIPYRPDAAKPDLVLRRAAMPRLIEGQAPTRIRPRTQILKPQGKAAYDIEEEEIPVMGLTVQQVWRRARWTNGETITWLAREKRLGGTRASSGLLFDQLGDL